MSEIATYYVTLKPIREGAKPAFGWRNIAYVNDPAIEEVGVYLNAHDPRLVADELVQTKILEYLKTVGIIKPDNWIEVTEEEYLSKRQINLGIEDSMSYNDLPKKDGSGQWLVRYEYKGPDDDKTRSFCSKILALGKIYTEEEIKSDLSNPEFGEYSIWNYKGSYGCRHVWRRQIYFENYENDEVRKVGFVPRVVSYLDDEDATTLNAFLSKDELMQVCAPLLVPDKDIFRDDEIGRYNMRFSSETIREMHEIALSNGTLEKDDLFKDTHKGSTAPSYVLDSWISESADDKAYTEYGFDQSRLPFGTLFVLSQITNKDYWENEIKANKKHAYSIEALINLSIIKLSKMEKEQILLPDGEHLINGTIYVVQDGVVIEKKEVTPEQEAIVEEVAAATPEEMADVPVEEVIAPVVEEAPVVEDDRIAKLEAAQESLMSEIAKLKGELEAPKLEELPVEMSDNRPMWRRISDGINTIKNQK